jgi:hypothetical protein
MNDALDDLLREHGRQWIADQPVPPPLDDAVREATALRGSGIKLAVAASVLAVAAIAGIAATWTLSGGSATPAGNSSAPTLPNSPAATTFDGTTPVTSPTSPPNTAGEPVLQGLTQRARSTAIANNDPNATGEFVQTTYGQAEIALDIGTSSSPPSDTDVFVIQLHGTFTCAVCHHPPGAPTPTGGAITLVLNAQSFVGYAFGIDQQPHDLNQLGNVIQLPVTIPPPDFSTPAGAVTATCDPFEIISTHQMPNGDIQVAWRGMDGVIWAALLSRNGADYEVQKCQYQAVPHG